MNNKAVIILNYLLYAGIITIPAAIIMSVVRYSYNKNNNVYFLASDKVENFFSEKEHEVESNIKRLSSTIGELERQIKELKQADLDVDEKLIKLNQCLVEKNEELTRLKNLKALQSCGFYDTAYDNNLLVSEYEKLKEVDNSISYNILNHSAFVYGSHLTLNGSQQQGIELMTNMGTYMVRSFVVNVEEYLEKMNKNNYEKQVEKIKKLVVKLEKSNERFNITLNKFFVKHYLKKASLYNDYIQRMEKERLERIEHNKKILEQKKLVAEEERKAKLISSEVEKNVSQLEKFKMLLEENPDSKQLLSEVEALETKNKELEDEKVAVESKLKSLGAGYIYVISNIGTFGEDVFKIGFTRRSEPYDRVKELSGASVPFVFDVHALIYDENASELETKVHHRLHDFRLNKENVRKEFFKTDLDKIKQVLSEELNKHVEFIQSDRGHEYFESLKLASGGEVHEH